jgi:UDPglucose 6-dehydrogenase
LGGRITYAADPYAACDGADALLILTEWKEFANLDLVRIKRALRSPIVLDGRNIFTRTEMAEAGLNYHSIGRPTLEVSHSFLKKGHIVR